MKMKNDRAEILLDDNDKVETPQHVKKKSRIILLFPFVNVQYI